MDVFNSIQYTSSSEFNIFSKKKVLIVDDFENFRLSLKKMLQEIGISSIDMVQNAKLALTACGQQSYDIIICDLNLGEGKNGQQLLEELKHLNLLSLTCIFIIITAETAKDLVMGALECQPDAYLSKPINQALLKKRLEKLVKQGNALSPIKKLISKKQFTQAIENCQEALTNENRLTPWYQKQLCELLIITKQYEEAKELCNSVLSERNVDWPHQMLGKIAFQQGDKNQSIKHYEQLLKVNPNSMAGYDEMAQVFLAHGSTEEAQKILQQAIDISPHTILRQQKLGQVSHEAGSLDIATKAFRRTLELGENSCYDDPDNYIDLAICLIDQSQEDEGANSEKAIQESDQLLKQVSKRFSIDLNTSTKIDLVKAKAAFHKNDLATMNELFEKVQNSYDTQQHELLPNTKFEIAKTLFLCDHKDTAETIFYQLVEEYADDKAFVNKVIAFLDEPVSQKVRQEAAIANKEGIILYEQKDYLQAAEKFKQALELSPRHPGLNLNLIQTCLYLLQEEFSPKWLELCDQSLTNVKHLRETHPQFNRYQKLLKPVQQWHEKAKKYTA
ncbi:tetratricopeptide repeat-containing response regulator [Spartinivicinus poritis]|uniref:Tetratricopeptide repeat protein n=1 Tax=Spartinivicinus poritis TaxID=2994640 RepID=A0ABT5U2V8_9GAMM|nr:tetratricopeptide repeat-containing response regulator [Spartinivicinus sp. A2-2]MDE1460704.1 tetratricopeptide repeat protein [Spartinivicinus sp. A2-2]